MILGSSQFIATWGREGDTRTQYNKAPGLCLKNKSPTENLPSYMAIDNRSCGSNKKLNKA